jgi:UDP-N-acetylmuramoyl-L-alanyl-D-glutamate--2,6-diaminopimelate ligase
MRLSALLSALPPELAPRRWLRAHPSDDPVIRGVAYDSRKVAPGDLFVALPGEVHDGHDYLEQAVELGAVALLVERSPERAAGPPRVVVPDARRALAPIAARFYGEPASECTLIGVTGTNGKTSTTYLVESILKRAGMRTGLIGTVEVRYAGERLRAVNTTPESLDLQRMLRSMRTHGVEAVVMEVSSHGLELGRVNGCRFAVAGFTNLTQDHLDFHGSMDAYRDSKELLFRRFLVPGGTAVLNLDDPASEKLATAAREAGARIVTTSRRADSPADARILEAEVRLDGTRARALLPSGEIELSLPLIGDFNLENAIVACAIADALGVPPELIQAGVAGCPQVPGRVELVEVEGPELPTVVVDYAHTPDAVDKLLAAVRPLARERLITLFGCGGDRDRAKRPLMARAVARWSDRVIATSDNPRSEDPAAILRDVEEGLAELRRVDPEQLDGSERAYATVPDRRRAIRLAIALARPGDSVVLAGKGHEDYQIVGREKLPFDDREEARRALGERLQGGRA